jgi:flagellar basal-body rod protein FlgC
MNDFSNALSVSAGGLKAQAQRLTHVSENIANADTPGYRRKVVDFETELHGPRATGEVATGRVRLDRSDLSRIYEPGHRLADATGHFDGSNVDLMIEIADAREAQRSYEANLKMFDQARQMSSRLMELLRR